MWVSKITKEDLTNDNGANVDCIIVFYENILCSLLELQRSMWLNKVKSVLLVTTTYHMRRSLHIARYLFPSHIKVCPCPADDTTTKRDNWMNTPEGIDRIKKEATNIVKCVNNGVIPDFEI